MNWCSIDCGKVTGITIWDETGKLIETVTVKDFGKITEFYFAVAEIKAGFDVVFALIEDYINFSKRFRKASKVETQIRVCEDVFDNRIMIYNRQWQKHSYSTREKKLLVYEYYGIDVNDHQADSCLMGREIFNYCEHRYGNGHKYLYKLATTTKKWPTKKDIINKLQQIIL